MLIAKGIHVTESLKYSMIINIAAVAFPLLIMLFADQMERKWHVRAPALRSGCSASVWTA